jgi:hypothetical protein
VRTYRLVPLVPALIAQGLLVLVHIPAMPGHEDSGEVDVQGLLDVRDDEIVELEVMSARRGKCFMARA